MAKLMICTDADVPMVELIRNADEDGATEAVCRECGPIEVARRYDPLDDHAEGAELHVEQRHQ